MKSARIIGLIVLLAGIGSLMLSNYISNQVLEGKGQIAAGEKKVEQGKSLFQGDVVSEQMGKAITSGAEKKIARGKEEIAYYEQVAEMLHTGGLIASIVGVGILIYSFTMKKKSR